MPYRVIVARGVGVAGRTKNHRVKVDPEDYEKLSKFKWGTTASRGGKHVYATRISRRDGKPCKLRMHRIIMGATDPNVFVDHINGDTLDNRKENLRMTSPAQNNQNSRSRGSYPAKNVSRCKSGFRVSVSADGVRKTKYFPKDKEQEALETAAAWREKMHGAHCSERPCF